MRNDTFNSLPDSNTAAFRTDSRTMLDDEQALREEKYFTSFIFSGGIHGTSSNLISSAFATEAFVPQRINQSSTTITYVDAGTATKWVIISANEAGISGWTRVPATSLYYIAQTEQPSLPANSAWLMKVTISSGAISAVVDYREPRSFALRKVFDMRDPLYASVGELISSIGARRATILIYDEYTLTASVSFPKNITIRIINGGLLNIPSTYTCTILGHIEAGHYRILKGKIVYTGEVVPQWWGARGDTLGLTPNNTGEDIESASWNSWNGLPFQTNLSYSPYGTTGSFVPPTTTPFLNTDTWDYIGGNMALWSGTNGINPVYFPPGTYSLNVSRGGTYPGYLLMRGQEKKIRGAGQLHTVIQTKENSDYFSTTNVGVQHAYKLITLYRISGPPTFIQNIQIGGPSGYAQASHNLTLIWETNTNAVRYADIWLTGAEVGIFRQDFSDESYITGLTGEFIFGQIIRTNATSSVIVESSTLWASVDVPGQRGIYAEGKVSVYSSRFVGFKDGPIYAAAGAIIIGNEITSTDNPSVIITDGVVIGNKFIGSANTLLEVQTRSIVSGNHFVQSGAFSAIRLGTGVLGSAPNINVTGNLFRQLSATNSLGNYAITAPLTGSTYEEAAVNSTVIAHNIFIGRAMQQIYSATMKDNIFDGIIGSNSFSVVEGINSQATSAQLNDSTYAINTTNKVLGKAVWNSTLAKFVYATGSTINSVWNDAVGAIAHTPIP